MSNYNVVHVPESAMEGSGGVVTAMFELIARSKHFCTPKVVTVDYGAPCVEVEGVTVLSSAPKWYGRFWRYTPTMSQNLKASFKRNSVIHIHGIWMSPQWIAGRYAIAHEIPFIITPHNMLGGWLWKRGKIRRLKKSLYWKYLVEPIFRQAAAIHALTGEEARTLKEFFPDTPIVTIPNGIDLDNILEQLPTAPTESERYFLFLGRLHPVKGLELIFQALAKVPVSMRIPLIVAGSAISESYSRALTALVSELGIEAAVEFVGPVSGVKKWTLLSGALAVCAPSYSEGMSMVALEAMACSTPVVTTHASGFSELASWGGVLINSDFDELHVALMDVIGWSLDERAKRGAKGCDLVRHHYTWDVVAQSYDGLYQQALEVNL